MQVRVLLGITLFILYKFTLRENIYLIHISELRKLDLDDGRPLDGHVHVHCLRDEQCACACSLNNMAAG